jgi:hypothetical protein
MVTDIQLIRVNDFLRRDEHGVIDPEQSKKRMREIAKASAEHDNHRVLLDYRDADGRQVSVVDVWEFAASLWDMGFERKIRVAVVNAPKDDFDRGAFLETCALNRGFELRAFRDFEKAMYWLAAD